MRMRNAVLSAAATAAVLCTRAEAQIWNESTDAGQLPGTAQVTVGIGALTVINAVQGTAQDVDLFRVHVSNPALVQVTQTNSIQDGRLFWFALNGVGLAFRDDIGPGDLHATISGAHLPGPGDYLLGYTIPNLMAGNNSGQEIWDGFPNNPNAYYVERTPDGIGAGNPVLSTWVDFNPVGSQGAYSLSLTGVEFSQAPSPSAAALLGLAGFAAAARRRRSR